MARPLRVQFPGAIYHVTSRMVGEQGGGSGRLFRDDADHERYLERLGERVGDCSVRLYMFCLMQTHVHLVFETPEANLSAFMHGLSTAYTVYFNRRHDRHGHVLDGRFKAKLVEGDRYLLNLSRYVHLNPVRVKRWEHRPRAERAEHLRAYRWSSYPGYIDRRREFPFVTYGPVLRMLDDAPRPQRTRYRRFVESGLVRRDEPFEEALRASPLSLGSETFRHKVERLYQALLEDRRDPEDVSFRRVTEPLAPATVLAVVAEELGVEVADLRRRRRGSLLRAVACHSLVRYAGMTQREAARCLGMGSGSAVSAQLRRLRDPRDTRDPAAAALREISRRLDRLAAGA